MNDTAQVLLAAFLQARAAAGDDATADDLEKLLDAPDAAEALLAELSEPPESFSLDEANAFADRKEGEEWKTRERWYRRENGKTVRIAKGANDPGERPAARPKQVPPPVGGGPAPSDPPVPPLPPVPTPPPSRVPFRRAKAFSERRSPKIQMLMARLQAASGAAEPLNEALGRAARSGAAADIRAVHEMLRESGATIPARVALRELGAAARDELVEYIDRRGAPVAHAFEGTVNPILRERVQEAMAWLGSVGGGAINPDPVVVRLAPGRVRAHYHNGVLHLAGNDLAETVVHELGHHLDAVHEVGEAAKRFYQHRFGAEQDIDMSAHFLGHQPGEMARRDHMAALFDGDERMGYYVGRKYPDGSTELVSHGVQLLYRNPLAFATIDPEYFNWTVAVLKGEHP